MIILKVGKDWSARDPYRRIMERGVIVICIEFPAVRNGEARFRNQITPRRTHDDLVFAVGVIAGAIRSAEGASAGL